jgi:hypothetical protein
MPPVGRFAKRIAFHRRAARRLARVALRRHLRAALVGRRALAAKAKGHHVRARRLLRRALRLKAAAVRARVRAGKHLRRIFLVRAARRVHLHRLAARRAGR